MAKISKGTIRRVTTALGSVPSGNEILGSLGLYGGFQLNSDASVLKVQGDISVVPVVGHAGCYRVMFPSINSDIQALDWFHVGGFTPRNPGAAETDVALVTGYNVDATTKQWYITVQISTIADGAIDPTPPQGFVVGVRAAFTLTPQANRQ